MNKVSNKNGNLCEGWMSVALSDIVFPEKEKVQPQACPDVPYLSLEHIEANTNPSDEPTN